MENSEKYLNALEFDKVKAIVSRYAKTQGGKEEALKMPLYNKKEEIEFQILLTTEAKTILDTEGVNSFPIDSVYNPDKIMTSNYLGREDIINLAKTLISSRKLKGYLLKNKDALNLNQTFGEALISNRELEDKINSVFDESCNIKQDATPELKRLFFSLNSVEDNLKSAINSLLKDSEFTSHLQDTICTSRGGRTVFQVKAGDKSKVKGIVHDVSSSNQTFFIEPEILVNINNKIRQIECEIESEIERILSLLSNEFHKIKIPLILAFRAMVEIDIIFAKAQFSILTGSTPPVLSDKKIIKLHSMFHPLLSNKENLVKNDFSIGEDYKSLLITGSNTGGKTVAMKTIGLIVLMMKAGMHITASFGEIFPFKNVYSDIEEKQDIIQSLSTFAAHIKNISYIVDHATKDDLVLFDELGAGTDPTEGAALARGILEYLLNKDIITISTTHLGELKILEYHNSLFKNASVEFDRDEMRPLYKLVIGLAGSSYAVDISKRYGLKDEIINFSKEILSKNSNQDDEVFRQIQQTRQEILSNAKKIEETKKETEQKEERINEKLKEINEKKKKSLDSFKKKYQSNFEAARAEIKQTLEELRKEKSEKIARRAYSRLAKLEEAARAEFIKDEDEISQKFPPVDWNEVQIGQSVLITGINQPAVLKTYPDNKGMVEIQIGLIKSKVHYSKLAKTNRKVSKGIKKLTVSFDDFHNYLSFNPRLDLRGMRVEEAIDSLEQHLDLAIRRNINEFTVIHGHGTGALKSAVRNYLKDNPYVLKFRSGEDAEGGDGVSIVDVK